MNVWQMFTITPKQTTMRSSSPQRVEVWVGGKIKVDEVTLHIAHSSLNVSTSEFEIIVTPIHFTAERNVFSLHQSRAGRAEREHAAEHAAAAADQCTSFQRTGLRRGW